MPHAHTHTHAARTHTHMPHAHTHTHAAYTHLHSAHIQERLGYITDHYGGGDVWGVGGGLGHSTEQASKLSGSCHCWRHLQSYTLHLCVGGVRPDPVCLCLLELRVATVNMHKDEV